MHWTKHRSQDGEPRLYAVRDRRSGRRYPYPAQVEVAQQRVTGCDISRSGMSVYMREPLSVGEITSVNLGGPCPESGSMETTARVLRSDASANGFLVALQFIEH
jgi:hypothetical protein